MIATILVVFVLQAISTTADPIADGYRVHQMSGPYALTHPVAEALYHIKINGLDYELKGNECVHREGKAQRVPCSYDPVSKTGTVHLPNTNKVVWVGFEMYPNSSTQTGFLTVYFTQGSTWRQVNDYGCIIPQHSSPAIIQAKGVTSVTVRCARKKRCHQNDRTLSISVDGIKKCEKDGKTPCQNFESPDRDLDGYELAVSKPTTLPIGGKTYVYCATDKSGLSFIINWTTQDFINNASRVDQMSGPYALTHPVAEALYHIKINGWDYRLKGKQCVHRGGMVLPVPCSYDPVSKTGTVHLPNTNKVVWVGFEMYPSSSTQTGYITYYFTQGSTWDQVDRLGCILPQHSSPAIIQAKGLTSVTIRCARKKICPYDDRTLSIHVDGIKKCERDGKTRCRKFESPVKDLDGYELAVSKPTTLPIGGKTYVYCATDMSGLSFIINWI